MYEYYSKNICLSVISLLQIFTQALSNEIGDSSLMQAVLSGTGSSNSRGRAQQILLLQQKVNKLEAMQNNSRNKDTLKSDGIIIDILCI